MRAVASAPRAKAPSSPQLWRLAGVTVPFDLIAAPSTSTSTSASTDPATPPEQWWKDQTYDGVGDALREAIAEKLGLGTESIAAPGAVTVVRRSLDSRGCRSGAAPKYAYIVDLELPAQLRIRRTEQLTPRAAIHRPSAAPPPVADESQPGEAADGGVVVVGAGPAGLFAALTLVDAGVRRITVIERGQPVERRGKDIGVLIHRRQLNRDSNFCFGEGGAGTWSDGKLTTQIGRNSATVRLVLEQLVKHGAPRRILIDGKPHLGTDRLVTLLREMRRTLLAAGVEFLWGTRVEGLLLEDGRAAGVRIAGSGATVRASSVVLAAGHSARELLSELHHAGAVLESKPFSVGFRIEHPQALIDSLRLGSYAGAVADGRIPAADYKLTWQARDRGGGAGGGGGGGGGELAEPAVGGDAFSFCMCPGGQIVPTSTDEGHLCVNGMSFSKRQSKWANSAVVTQVTARALEPYQAQHGALAGLAFQEAVEKAAAEAGGGGLTAPVQLASDFISGRSSDPRSLPPSSYRLGVRAARLDLMYPPDLTGSLRAALLEWERQLPGFASDPQALLHGVETRTSCPVQIGRDRTTLECSGLPGLFPAGEGSGWAGGIVSAAVDGIRVGRALAKAMEVPQGRLVGLAVDDDHADDAPAPSAPPRAARGQRRGPRATQGGATQTRALATGAAATS